MAQRTTLDAGAAVVSAAASQIGKPYRWAQPVSASNPDPGGFDCSGLAMWCWAKVGVGLTHYTGTQWAQTKKRPLSQAQPGDLVFFGIPPVPHHVAIYAGGGEIIEAPTFGVPVRRTNMSRYSDTIGQVGALPGSSSSSSSSGGSVSSESVISQFLTGTLGFTPAGAAGALGNFQVESGFNPGSTNAREGAIGIAQWEGGRRTALQRYAASTGGSESDLRTQLGYLAQELRSGYSGVLAAMRSATDPAAAAAVWDSQFEASAGTTRAARVSDATSIYQSIKSGAQLTGGASISADAAGGVNIPAPPYSVAPTPPLTADQRTAEIQWIASSGYSTKTQAQLTQLSDVALTGEYQAAVVQYLVHGTKVKITDPTDSLFSFDGLQSLVIKSVFSLVGLGLVLVGAGAAARRETSGGDA